MANSIFKVHEMINKVGFEFDDATAKKVTQLAEKASQLAADNMTAELSKVVADIGNIFNQALSKLGKQQIDLSDMIKMPDNGTIIKLTNSFVSQIATNVSDAIAAGINDGVSKAQDNSKEIELLTEQKTKLANKKNIFSQKYSKIKEYPLTTEKLYREFRVTKLDNDIETQALKVMDDFYDSLEKLSSLPRGTKEYFDALVNAFEKSNEAISMGKTLHTKEIQLKNDDTRDFFKDVKDNVYGVIDNRQYITDMDAYINKLNNYITKELPEKIHTIELKIKELSEIGGGSTLNSNNVEDDISAAKKRIAELTPKKRNTKIDAINNAVNYTPPEGQFSLKSIAKKYQESVDRGDNWEEQYQWLIKFVRAYDAYSEKKFKDSRDQKNLLEQFKPLYESVAPKLSNAVDMLKGVVSVDNDSGDSQKTDNEAFTTNDINNKVTSTTKIAEESERKAQAEEVVADAERKAREEAERKRIADEASLKAAEEEKATTEAGIQAAREVASVSKEQKSPIGDTNYTPGSIMDKYANLFDSKKVENADAVEKEAVAQKTITEELNKQKEILPKLIHIGYFDGYDLSNFANSDRMGKAPGQVNEGYGMFGDGVFTVTIDNWDAVLDLMQRYGRDRLDGNGDKTLPLNKIHVIDPSDYKFYINETEDEGMSSMKALHRMQKFMFSQAGVKFDKPLSPDIDAQVVYKTLQDSIKGFTWTFDEFNSWMESQINEIKQYGWINAPNMDESKFFTSNKDFLNSHNPATRFMMAQGYDGIYNKTGNVKLDGFTYGSVIYNPNFDKLKTDESFEYLRDFLVYIGKTKDEANEIIDGINQGIRDYYQYIFDKLKGKHLPNVPQFLKVGETTAQEELKDVKGQAANIDDDAEIIAKENGTLEDKLELLRDIADQYASNITQKDRDRYEELNQKDMDTGLSTKEEDRYYELGEKIDEADSALEEFGQTYDKIILKLENGKKVEILPDDKGLRSLYKFADEYGETYGGVEIEDVIFERIKQETVAHQENVDAIKEETKAQEELNAKKEAVEPIYKEYKAYRAVQDPSASGKTKKEALEDYGAEVWAKDKGVAIGYAEDQDGKSDILVGTIKPKNPLIIEANGLRWDDFGKMSGLTELFPGIADVIKQGDPFDTQKYLHEQARNAGYDSVIYKDVRDDIDVGINNDGGLTTTIAVLNDSIVSLDGSLSEISRERVKGKGWNKQFSDTLGEVPAYYEHGEAAQIQQVAETSKQAIAVLNGSLEKQNEVLKENISLSKESNNVADAQPNDTNVISDTKTTESGVIKKVSETLQNLRDKITQQVNSFVSSIKQLTNDNSIDDSDLGQSTETKAIDNNKVAIDEVALETVLNKVFANILNPQTQQNDSIEKAPWALESTLQTVKGVLDNIQTNTAKIGTSETQQPVTTNVGNVLATENTLLAIKNAVEAINNKVIQGATNGSSGSKRENSSSQNLENGLAPYESNQTETERTNRGNNSNELLQQKIITANNALIKYKTTLQSIGLLHGEIEGGINALSSEMEELLNNPNQDNLNIWNQHFQQLQKVVGSVKILSQKYKELGEWQAKLEAAEDGTSVAKDAQNNINRLNAEIAAEKEKCDIFDKELQQIYELAKAEQERTIASQQAKKDFNQEVKQSRSKNRVSYASSLINSADKTLGSLWKIDDDNIDLTQIPQIQVLRTESEKLREIINNINTKGGIVGKEDSKRLKEQIPIVAQYVEQVKDLINNYEKLSGDNVKVIGTFSGNGDWKQELTTAIQTLHNGKAKIVAFDDATRSAQYTVKGARNTVTEYTGAIRDAGNAMVSVQGKTKKLEGFFDAIKRKTKEIFTYFAGSSMIYKVVNQLKQGITYIKEIDSALTELKKVTDETEETYDKFLKTAAKTADKVGSTIKDVVSSTADWARLNI